MADLKDKEQAAGAEERRRLSYYTAGFLRQRRVRRILELSGYDLTLGRAKAEGLVAVWGRSPYAARGEKAAKRAGAKLLRVEDAFLRSLQAGRAGEPPLGLMLDDIGVYFDASAPSRLEQILAHDRLDNTDELKRAHAGIARIKEAQLSKYASYDLETPCPEAGYVLVIDQTRKDASVTYGNADANTFKEMLYYAQEDNPGARIVIKTHPETQAGYRQGYFSEADTSRKISLFEARVSPWALMEGAVAVYTVTSQMGFEAILAGHRPQVFGQPFYAGWGLSEDRNPRTLPRRGRVLTRAQLFLGAMIKTPTWYDVHNDCLTSFETALGSFEAEVRAWREDHKGWSAAGMRLWKRAPLQQFFGRHGRLRFVDTPKPDGRAMIWAGKAQDGDKRLRLEDGFLRSRGLGAALTPPLSLVLDDLGIYYDPTRESRLERLVQSRANLRPDQSARVRSLIEAICAQGVTKYNLKGEVPALPEGRRILVPGQVEDDASIRLGAGEICTNLGLLAAARAANPKAILVFKPHPDVEAGLRPGAVAAQDLVGLADVLVENADAAALLDQVEEVWTMTSLIGFEALLRGLNVTTTGAPFYAGWGLTTDKGRVPARRGRHVSLESLAHAALIDYPRYFDPVSQRPCSPELALRRLSEGGFRRGPANRLLAKLQGVFASYARFWR
ncbi:capsular polysaccharide biosynthesis protein [Lentibacter sp.]|uniref:capsular polysaccharide biosynthesis protein n=1 Tax=Lentibacter sp. TaxID=2024994 RepID=UPI003F69896D